LPTFLPWQVFKIYIFKLTQNKLLDWIRLQDFRSCEFLKFNQIYYICLGLLFFNFTPMFFFLSSKFDPYSFNCYLSYLASYCFLKLHHFLVLFFKFSSLFFIELVENQTYWLNTCERFHELQLLKIRPGLKGSLSLLAFFFLSLNWCFFIFILSSGCFFFFAFWFYWVSPQQFLSNSPLPIFNL